MIPPRIAAITSTPPGFNPGMIATELALIAFLRRHGWLEQTALYGVTSMRDRLADVPEAERDAAASRATAGIEHRSAAAEYASIAAADVVLLWADFLHSAEHVRQMQDVVDADLLARGEAPDPARVRRVFLMADAGDALLARTISFGTSLLFNTQRDEADAAYAVPFARLLRGAKRVWVRDALSAARVAHVRNDYDRGYFGVDCALLLGRDDVLRGAPDGAAAREMLVFLGRDAGPQGALLELAAELGRALDLAPRWLPWGDERAFPSLRGVVPPLAGALALDAFQLLAAVARAPFVVTDTYHLAVIAWNLGVPAVCAFPGRSEAAADVSSGAAFNRRDKRETFYSQYDALEFLVRPEELADPDALRRRAERIVLAARDPALCAAIVGTIHRHAARVERDLAAAMEELLAHGLRRAG